MTFAEKLAVIGEMMARLDSADGDSASVTDGVIFELVCAVIDAFPEISDAAPTVDKVLSGDRALIAQFYRCACKYHPDIPYPFPPPESAELDSSVIIPSIPRLDAALQKLGESGIILTKEYGDSFNACAENVEYGRIRYVLLPYANPEDGRLGVFDKLRLNCGLKIHAMCLMEEDDGGVSKYQLCAAGFPDEGIFPASRLAFRAETDVTPEEYLSGVRIFGAAAISANFERTADRYLVNAVIDTGDVTDMRDFSGLIRYLHHGAELKIDGYYEEYK